MYRPEDAHGNLRADTHYHQQQHPLKQPVNLRLLYMREYGDTPLADLGGGVAYATTGVSGARRLHRGGDAF